MGKGLRVIEKNTFSNSSLKYVNIPDNIKEIREESFSYCEKLVKVRIGKGVEYIDPNAFIGSENVIFSVDKRNEFFGVLNNTIVDKDLVTWSESSS